MIELDFVFWYWWVLAVALLIMELLISGFFFLWLAASAFIVGALLPFAPNTSLGTQTLLFSVLSIVAVFIWRKYAAGQQPNGDHPFLNRRAAQYIGRTFVLVEAIENGQGRIKIGDSFWTVRGEDCEQGRTVKIIDAQGSILLVARCDAISR